MIRKGSRYPAKIAKGSRAVHALFKGERPIWMSPDTQRQVIKMWLEANATTICHTVRETDAHWFEIEVILPAAFTGNPVDGWTGPMVAGKPDIHLGLHWSADLLSWTGACAGWTAAPGTWPETIGSTLKRWRARYEVPIWWEEVMVDLTISSDRHDKSITGIDVLASPISLPNFPYSMPADASQLQTDLIAEGYTGATVTTTTSAITTKVRNHLPTGITGLFVTMSGSNVTAVKYTSSGSTISLPSYPYSMPSSRAQLQTDLRAAGVTGAVVTLYSGSWEIVLPDIVTTGNIRQITATISPADPYPGYDMFGNYQGEIPATHVIGDSGNVRTPTGDPLQESLRGFARLGLILP